MRIPGRLPINWSLALILAGILWVAACGDDMDASASATTSAGATSAGATTTGATTTESTSDATSATTETSAGATTTETGTITTTVTTSTTTATTGAEGPPDYPPPDGPCPDGTAQVFVGNGQLCAPFCAGEGAACTMEGLGVATSSCQPFTNSGTGSGQACGVGEPCPSGEGCDGEGACHTIVFWSCLIDCGPGGECPEPMFCTVQNRCGYPL